ncbi:MAG: glycosyl hydrolase repeat-containing protein, partial [Firmicutes bacterium]|nr:glycosyl hydrolase repeat-containing protein [Bacillota bacterium]
MATNLAPILNRALSYRSIGPYRGGRVVAVAGHSAAPQTYYFGSTGGGVWKTEDGGITWGNRSDGFFQRASVGALAVAESDPNVIFAGMGETTIRSNVTLGDGVYKSTDGGATWQHSGLAGSQQIAKIRVHPADPNTVYVAAFGHIFGPNAERGVYRSTDGGKHWDQILFRSDRAG